jgi:hypothetical protein
MFDTVTKSVKWVSIPVLLMFSVFTRFAAEYEFLANLVICTGAIICVQRAVQRREHGWAAAFVGVVIVFSPLALAAKIFLLMGLISIATVATVVAAFRTRPQLAEVGIL